MFNRTGGLETHDGGITKYEVCNFFLFLFGIFQEVVCLLTIYTKSHNAARAMFGPPRE